jgi:hypothetical protein
MDKYNHWLGKFFGRLNKQELYAVTFGQTAYYSCSIDLVGAGWRAHEDKHKEQYARDGWVKFLTRYIWQRITKGYENIDYEKEAMQAARDLT